MILEISLMTWVNNEQLIRTKLERELDIRTPFPVVQHPKIMIAGKLASIHSQNLALEGDVLLLSTLMGRVYFDLPEELDVWAKDREAEGWNRVRAE